MGLIWGKNTGREIWLLLLCYCSQFVPHTVPSIFHVKSHLKAFLCEEPTLNTALKKTKRKPPVLLAVDHLGETFSKLPRPACQIPLHVSASCLRKMRSPSPAKSWIYPGSPPSWDPYPLKKALLRDPYPFQKAFLRDPYPFC